ncbi:TLR4 interactor with leucine rich repeats [Protopterus annectens]|uniref:TLR4 interactor with leucine rich repeats n=1 Tax=Protopterus annectens TaxID=7888 RepID=UPI001CFC2332|nr:TLR4 interactor with leucine rich repeats [Protopterus annectens]
MTDMKLSDRLTGEMERLCMLWVTLLVLCSKAEPICPDRCDCQQFQHIMCTNRGLRTVPKESIQSPGDILTYSLGGNFITNVSVSDFHRFSQLLRLDLQYNQIQYIHSKTFEKLSRLEELYLGNNLISSVTPGTLNPLRKLRILYINGNELSKLNSETFNNLENLIKLRLDGNAIEHLQDSLFSPLRNLLYLHLESNQIRTVHKNAFANLGKLRFLNLSGNSQSAIRNIATFGNLRSLTTLILSENKIQQVGHRVFQNLQKLAKLALSGNRISLLGTEVFHGLSSLKELLLDRNFLTEISDGLFSSLGKLEELDLSHNAISTVHPLAFRDLANLRVLKLQGNALTSLSGDIFSSNAGLYSLELDGNSWTCDCRLRGLKQWMNLAHSQGKLLTVFVQCRQPPSLRGKYLDYLNSSQLLPLPDSGVNDLCIFPQKSSLRNRLSPSPAKNTGTADRNVQSDQGGTVGPAFTDTQKTRADNRDVARSWGVPSLSTSPSPTKGYTVTLRSEKVLLAEHINRLHTFQGNRTPRLGISVKAEEDVTPSPIPVSTGLPFHLDSEKHFLRRHGSPDLAMDPCYFNKYYLCNLTADVITAETASLSWKVVIEKKHRDTEPVHFRVLFDRFGQSVKFHRFVYVSSELRSVTLQELKEDTPYLVCIESVIEDRVCQVASRDHCIGLMTLPAGSRAVNYPVLTVCLLAANAFLVLLIIIAWTSRALRKKLNRRKSPVHVRQMYSTRRPLRSMGTGVSGDFSGFQSTRPRVTMSTVNEADLIEFPCDRFLDSNNLRRDDVMHRFAD